MPNAEVAIILQVNAQLYAQLYMYIGRSAGVTGNSPPPWTEIPRLKLGLLCALACRKLGPKSLNEEKTYKKKKHSIHLLRIVQFNNTQG